MCFLPLIALLSCDMAEPVLKSDGRDYVQEEMTMFSVEISGVRKCYETRSVLTDENIETRITGITLAAYGENGALVDAKHYTSDFSEMSLSIGTNISCNIYALANMGDMSAMFPSSEDDVPLMEYTVSSYEQVDECGIPMCAELTVWSGTQENIIYLDRLFAKVNVRILHTGLADASSEYPYVFNMCNKSLYMRQVNGRLTPFADGGSRAEHYGDIMDIADYNPNLNDKNTYQGPLKPSELGPGPGYLQDISYVFYIPENVQGRLLPGNSDPFGKVYDNIGPDAGDVCTYLEFNAKKERSLGYEGSVMFRYYLGADNTSDFSVERNCRYDLTLDFTEEGFFADSWKVTRGDDWTDYRSLYFLEDSYQIYKGGTVDVMVHFNRNISGTTDSEPYPDRWLYDFDETAMNNAGLSFSFDPHTLVTAENGCKEFCFRFTAADDAEAGESFPLTVMTTDGSIVDHAVLNIVGSTGLSASWNSRPEYVSQYGTFTVSGYEASDLPLKYSVSDESKLSCIKLGDDMFRVVAYGSGPSAIIVSSSDGSKTASVSLDVSAPRLKLDEASVELNPDGRSVSVGYEYLTASGNPLANVSMDAWNSVLKPSVTGSPYFETDAYENTFDIYVGRLYDGDDRIDAGGIYDIEIVPQKCGDVAGASMSVTVVDPFEDVVQRDYGSIDDYTLFGLTSANASIKGLFTSEIQKNSSFSFDGPLVNSDPSCVKAELVPRWRNGFSYENGVYELSWNRLNGDISIKQRAVDHSTKHSAGIHDVMVMVENRHSSETIDASCGTIGIYVHTAIGADAEFNKRQCCYPVGGQTFAGSYNAIAPNNVYPYPNSTNYIHYMDVTMKWMTNVSGVFVFEQLRSRSIAYDSDKFLLPSRKDGEVHEKLLFSVYTGTGNRDEQGGGRHGVGHVLYRALMTQTYDYNLSDATLKELFLGYKSGSASGSFAPAYKVSDIGENAVSTQSPFYFAPSKYPDYRDEDGNGYHVFHFLEELVPRTCGWIDLL